SGERAVSVRKRSSAEGAHWFGYGDIEDDRLVGRPFDKLGIEFGKETSEANERKQRFQMQTRRRFPIHGSRPWRINAPHQAKGRVPRWRVRRGDERRTCPIM